MQTIFLRETPPQNSSEGVITLKTLFIFIVYPVTTKKEIVLEYCPEYYLKMRGNVPLRRDIFINKVTLTPILYSVAMLFKRIRPQRTAKLFQIPLV